MTFERLRITGRDGERYELGAPMHVHDGSVHLGAVDPVRLSRDGTEVHIERFLPSRFVKEQRRNFGPLVLLEVTSYLAEQFHGIQTISYSLSREIEMHGDGMKVASARSALLQDIGAEGVTITPRPDHETPGNFVVEGVWAYNERNLAALGHCLAREREIYRQWEAAAGPAAAIPALRDRLRQLLVRGTGEAGMRGGEESD
ncbi:hypothetical protein QTH97_17885 [Variovorax sp. J22R24]|uniref:hypothetical protein n=1 Tax=Variovorax gracilis TaxID=3053502 RepID=UPI002578018C|nr:hypothetical protein [Variovorax sp. J22R24]MDM0106820.1 hypothetical protein [Variovorax sp. J22R24]